MKLLLLFVIVFSLSACDPKQNLLNMKSNDWKVGKALAYDQIYGVPPASSDPTRHLLFGAREEDSSHHLYDIPADVPIADIVHYFEVGSHGAQSYGYDRQETVDLVAEKATKISEIIPCHAIFADGAGLKLKFDRPITEEELVQIERLFPEEVAMQAGLDKYISEWDGHSRLLGNVKKENLIHFWWD